MIARVAGLDIPVLSASIEWSFDEISEFDVTVPIRFLPGYQDVLESDIELIEDGEMLISGFVNDPPVLESIEPGILQVKLGCFNELGRLTLYRSRTDGHYQDSTVLGIIGNLLEMTNGAWMLSGTETMVNEEITTTVDLRRKETLFAQIAEVVKSVPDVHLRYGGYNTLFGMHELNIGYFGDTNTQLIEGKNLSSLRLKSKKEPSYTVVESYGNTTADRRISLADSLSDLRTIFNVDYPRFPITEDPSMGTWVVTDQESSGQRQVTKFFELSKTKNDQIPTAVEIAQAGYALWLKTVRFMKQNSPHETYSAIATVEEIPEVGDKARIRSVVEEQVLNPITQDSHYEKTFEVDGDYRITKVKHSMERYFQFDAVDESPTQVWRVDLELSSNDESEDTDPDLELYERLENGNSFDSLGGIVGFNIPPPVMVTWGPGDAADCNYNGMGSNTGRNYALTAPTPPTWATKVSYVLTLDPEDSNYSVISAPSSPGDDLQICVTDENELWPPDEDITAYAQFIYQA
jgi:hypothetical protein